MSIPLLTKHGLSGILNLSHKFNIVPFRENTIVKSVFSFLLIPEMELGLCDNNKGKHIFSVFLCWDTLFCFTEE